MSLNHKATSRPFSLGSVGTIAILLDVGWKRKLGVLWQLKWDRVSQRGLLGLDHADRNQLSKVSNSADWQVKKSQIGNSQTDQGCWSFLLGGNRDFCFVDNGLERSWEEMGKKSYNYCSLLTLNLDKAKFIFPHWPVTGDSWGRR
jgi:hypothetical protein